MEFWRFLRTPNFRLQSPGCCFPNCELCLAVCEPPLLPLTCEVETDTQVGITVATAERAGYDRGDSKSLLDVAHDMCQSAQG